MIFAHIDIDAEERSVIVVVLDARNLAEMRLADPLTVEMSWGGNPLKWPGNASIMVAYEEDIGKACLMLENSGPGLVRYLERGRLRL